MKFSTAAAAVAATTAVVASTVAGAPMPPNPSMKGALHPAMMAGHPLPRMAMAYPGPTGEARGTGSLAAVTRQEEGEEGSPAEEGEGSPAWEGEGGPEGEGEAAGSGEEGDGPAPKGRHGRWGYGGYGYGYPGWGYGWGGYGWGYPGYGWGYGWY